MQVLSRGPRANAWRVTVQDSYADSHLTATLSAAGSASSEAAIHKTAKYISIASTHLFVPVAIETSGVLDNAAEEFLQKIGYECIEMTGDANEASYMFQQISAGFQRGNAIAFNGTFRDGFRQAIFLSIIVSLWLCASGRKIIIIIIIIIIIMIIIIITKT